MATLNGGFKLVLALFGVGSTIAAGAVGYGNLKSNVQHTADRVAIVEQQIEQKSASPEATPAGTALLGSIITLNKRLDRIEAQLDRIEAKLSANNHSSSAVGYTRSNR